MLVRAGRWLARRRHACRNGLLRPAGQIGKVFGFVSAGLALGGAIMPVPYGMLIDAGKPQLVLTVVAGLWLLSLLFAGSARVNTSVVAVPAPAE